MAALTAVSNKDLGWGTGGLGLSVLLLISLSLLSILLVDGGGGMRGTLIVALTEFDSSISKSFSRRDASWSIEFEDLGGGAIVKVAEIF